MRFVLLATLCKLDIVLGMTVCNVDHATCDENEFNCNYIIAVYLYAERRVGVLRSCNR
jgi:hypothetical protein